MPAQKPCHCTSCGQLLPKPGIARARSSARDTMVIALVGDAFGVEVGLLLGGDLHRSTSHARQVAMHVLRTAYGMSMPEIARAVGQADHTSVMYGLKKVAERLGPDADPNARRELREIVDRLVGRARRWTSDGAEIAQRLEAIPYRLADAPQAAAGGDHG